MGQKIELKTTQFGKNVIFDLNRSLSGQDGETYHNIAHASLTIEISAQLAIKLFQFSNYMKIFLFNRMLLPSILQKIWVLQLQTLKS